MKKLIQILKVIQIIVEFDQAPEKEKAEGNMHFCKSYTLWNSPKSVFLNPNSGAPILQEDHCLDVTEEIESNYCTTMLTLFKP